MNNKKVAGNYNSKKIRKWALALLVSPVLLTANMVMPNNTQAAKTQVTTKNTKSASTKSAISQDNFTFADGILTITGGNLASPITQTLADNNIDVNSVKQIKINSGVTVSNCVALFANLPKLETIDGIDNLDTANITDMSGMFKGDNSLTTINGINKLNVSNITSMQQMFSSNFKLDNMDLSSWNTQNVTNMDYLFLANYAMSNTEAATLEDWNTQNVTSMVSTFDKVSSLTKLDLSKWNMANVKMTVGMLSGMYKLTDLNISNWKLPKLFNMSEMFSQDFNLETLNLSGWQTPKSPQPYVYRAFNQMNSLRQITFGPGFSTDNMPPTPPSTEITKLILPNTTNDMLWQNVGSGTVDNPEGNYQIKNYDSGKSPADTYVLLGLPQKVTVTFVDDDDNNNQVVTDQDFSFNSRRGTTIHYDVSKDLSDPKLANYELADGQDSVITYTVDANGQIVVHLKHKTQPSTPTDPSDPGDNGEQPGNPSQPNNPGDNIAKKGQAVYAVNNIYLYKKATFKQSERKVFYARKGRLNRPMFVVTGYSKSSAGRLRYQVRDVNHHSKSYGQTGYITANNNCVVPVYYKTHGDKYFTVINANGINSYKNKNFTGKVTHYKQGQVLRVVDVIKYHLTTRFKLSNGKYITANKKLVMAGKQATVTKIKAKTPLNRYQTVNLTKRNQHFKKGTILTVKGYDYSNANNVSQHDSLRYKVAGGYVSGNPKLVAKVK